MEWYLLIALNAYCPFSVTRDKRSVPKKLPYTVVPNKFPPPSKKGKKLLTREKRKGTQTVPTGTNCFSWYAKYLNYKTPNCMALKDGLSRTPFRFQLTTISLYSTVCCVASYLSLSQCGVCSRWRHCSRVERCVVSEPRLGSMLPMECIGLFKSYAVC